MSWCQDLHDEYNWVDFKNERVIALTDYKRVRAGDMGTLLSTKVVIDQIDQMYVRWDNNKDAVLSMNLWMRDHVVLPLRFLSPELNSERVEPINCKIKSDLEHLVTDKVKGYVVLSSPLDLKATMLISEYFRYDPGTTRYLKTLM